MTDSHPLLLETPEEISALLEEIQTVAVLGIKPPESGQPAYYVPEYAQSAGLTIIPVPVYYPELTELLGAQVHRSLRTVPTPVDLVNVFRRPADLPAHLDDLLALRPRAVWFQLGIRHDAVARSLAEAGIAVVQDRCLMVELQERGR